MKIIPCFVCLSVDAAILKIIRLQDLKYTFFCFYYYQSIQGTFKLAYTKQLRKINKVFCIIHKFVKLIYEKTAYENTIFVGENL